VTPDARLGLLGFSRGGELSLLLGATYPQHLCAIVAPALVFDSCPRPEASVASPRISCRHLPTRRLRSLRGSPFRTSTATCSSSPVRNLEVLAAHPARPDARPSQPQH